MLAMSSLRNTLCHFSTSCSYRKWLFCYRWGTPRGWLRPAGSWSTRLRNMEQTVIGFMSWHIITLGHGQLLALKGDDDVFPHRLFGLVLAIRHVGHSWSLQLQPTIIFDYCFICWLFISNSGEKNALDPSQSPKWHIEYLQCPTHLSYFCYTVVHFQAISKLDILIFFKAFGKKNDLHPLKRFSW